ncbi:hypothetical protein FKP32DRAFT_1761410 [Trametes sanguinea]|nr:hypothetical protein FKP32DRAFT_1761410 [Trametes sanguinea]
MSHEAALLHDTAAKVNGLANTAYAKTAKELNGFVGHARAEGAQSDLNLPRVVVIGNQSAGKSSLVEAISKIKVPRDAGTCTRCPMELRLSSSDGPWVGQVSIRFESATNGKGIGIGISEPPRSVREVPFGDIIYRMEDLELMLRRAQAAVLNTTADNLSSFLHKEEGELRLLSEQAPRRFSHNVVCVDLSGPDMPDLSFVDLPGLIQNDEGNGEVQLVEELVRSYIKSHNTLIVVALPMTDDLQNQKAAQLAREVDPHGLRTIGALTKPDAIPVGALGTRKMYLDVVEGRAHPTKHGYFVVRHPDDVERQQGISHEEARAAEARFFAEQKPWATSLHRHRFGVENLIACVSDRLTELIRADLPRIQLEVSMQRDACVKQLKALPQKITEPYTHTLRLVHAFAEEVKKIIQGSPEHKTLVQSNSEAYVKLAEAISDTAPPFLPYASWEEIPSDATSKLQADTLPKDRIVWLDTVKSQIQASLTRELPNNVPYSVKCSFIQNFQQDWPTHVDRCFSEVERNLKQELKDCIEQHFSRFSILKGAVRAAVLNLVDTHVTIAQQQQKYLLKYEMNPPATQNRSGLAKLRADWLERYQAARAALNPPVTAAKASENPPWAFIPSRPGTQQSQQPTSPTLFGTPRNSDDRNVSGSGGSFSAFNAAQATKNTSNSSATPRQQPQTSPLKDFTFKWGPPPTPAPAASGASEPKATFSFNVSVSQPQQIQTPSKSFTPIWDQPLASTSAASTQQKPSQAGLYEEEIAFMAEIRAYFDISSKRLADNIPAAIDEHLLYAFAKALFDTLVQKLGLTSDDAAARCARYFADTPDVAALREDLEAKKRRLDKVYQELCEFGF